MNDNPFLSKIPQTPGMGVGVAGHSGITGTVSPCHIFAFSFCLILEDSFDVEFEYFIPDRV